MSIAHSYYSSTYRCSKGFGSFRSFCLAIAMLSTNPAENMSQRVGSAWEKRERKKQAKFSCMKFFQIPDPNPGASRPFPV